ncbi:MAG: hypothetical protein ACRD04_12440 [Terriglobales bacterium]
MISRGGAASSGPAPRPARRFAPVILRAPARRGRLLATLALLALSAAAVRAQARPCLVYRRGDDLFARCGRKRDVLLLSEKELAGFAFLDDTVAVMTGTPGAHGYPGVEIHLIRPKSRVRVAAPVIGSSGIYTSCGTILDEIVGVVDGTWDILAGRMVDFTDLYDPVCSRDRSRTLGEEGLASGLSELVTRPPLAAWTPGLVAYNYGISPSGKYLAYIQVGFMNGEYMAPIGIGSICVRPVRGASSCYPSTADMGGAGQTYLSVSDAGLVLYSGEQPYQPCFDSGFLGQDSATAPPGHQGPCYGVYVAGPHSPPRLLVQNADEPTWVPEAAVKRLLADAARRRSAGHDCAGKDATAPHLAREYPGAGQWSAAPAD